MDAEAEFTFAGRIFHLRPNINTRDDGPVLNNVRILCPSALPQLLLAVLSVSQARAAYAASIPNNLLQPVNADLTSGRADDAISRLSSSLAIHPEDAEAHHLLCRVYYQEERWDDAIHEWRNRGPTYAAG